MVVTHKGQVNKYGNYQEKKSIYHELTILDTVRNEFFSNKPHYPGWCTQRAERKQKNSDGQEFYTLGRLISTIL